MSSAGYRAADLRLCFRICKISFSHGAAHIKKLRRKYKVRFFSFFFPVSFVFNC